MKLIAKACLLGALLFTLLGASTPAYAELSGFPHPLSPCIGGKYKCIIKLKSCLLGCYSKAIKSGAPVSIACLQKCRLGFSNPLTAKGCVDKVNGKAQGCLSLSDGPVLRSKTDAHVLEVVKRVHPGGFPATSPCVAGKLKCFGKYNACILNLIVKIAKSGLPVSPNYALCNKYLRFAKSCIWKLEQKYHPLSATPCPTFDDQGKLKNMDDAFTSDVVYQLLSSNGDMNTQRCTNNTSIQCTTNAPCIGGGGTCQFYFGAPLPLAAGGVSTCVTNQWNGAMSGTFDTGTGASAGTAAVLARVHTGISIPQPCPRCVGADIPNDGISGGTCDAGPRSGQPCDGNGESPEPSFGVTSLDCPPNPGGLIATLPIDLTNTNDGPVSITLAASSPNCNGQIGKKCLCASCSLNSQIPCRNDADCAAMAAGTCTNSAGEPRRVNGCIDNTSTGADETICSPLPDGTGECSAGPFDQHCNIEAFRGCINDLDCPFPDDFCTTAPRPCTAGYNGIVGDTVAAVGSHDTPIDHTGTSTFASVFCVAPTGSTSVNSVAGLPGPGRLELSGVSADDGTATLCPSIASFLPGAKSGVLHTGWTGLAHHAKVVGQGKVTVSVTGCTGAPPSCACTYTGPIANP